MTESLHIRLNLRTCSFFACIAAALTLGAFVACAATTPEISDVAARQHYPWDGKIDISFTVSGVESSAELVVSAKDSSTGEEWTATALSGNTGGGAGRHTVVWDLDAQGISLFSSNIVFSVLYRRYIKPLYAVVDISGGKSVSSFPLSYLADVPAGGWSDEYKTNCIVLRRVESGTFTMGCDTSEVGYWGEAAPRHQVTIGQPFFMGVFEVTQAQYEKVIGSNPSANSGATRPVDSISWNNIRGSANSWPASSDVTLSSFMGQLRKKTGHVFDLPTEAQWEYACRAGTTTALNNGRNLTDGLQDSAMDEVGRYSGNASDGKGGYFSAHTAVGSYKVNRWGLYDMHGNVWEWCLDWYQDRKAFSTAAVSDPKGPASGTYRVLRGGGWNTYARSCRSAERANKTAVVAENNFGFRACCAMDSTLTAVRVPEVICTKSSGATVVDMRTEPTVASLRAVYDVAWDGGGASDEIVVLDNGDEAFRATGSGERVWTPEYGGRHELVYRAPDGSETRTAAFYVGMRSDFPIKTGGDAMWRDDSSAGPYGGAAFMSGAISDSSTTWMEVVVPAEGRVSFRWKASTESYLGEVFDYAYVSLDGEPLGWLGRIGGHNVISGMAIGGETEWLLGTVDVYGSAPHVIRWTFVKDEVDEPDSYEDWVKVADIAFDPFSSVSRVDFSLGGGSGTVPDSLNEIVHTVVNLPWAAGLSMDRHSFAGWSDGSATYPEGAAYEVPATNVELVAVWSANVLRAPTISSDDATNGCVTVSESVMVEITADDGATILYTLDGSDPASCGVAYVGPFQAVEQEVTVKAVAVRAGFFDSDVSTFSFRRRAAGPVECLNLGSGTRFVSFGGSAEWSRVLDADSHDGDAAMRSGVISAGETSSLSIAVYGPGNISFWWKTSSEKIRDRKCDYVAFTVDGNEFAWLGGEADWTNRTFRIRGAGEHVLVWTYGKDESGDAGNDCAWLDEISWNAASAIPEMGDADGPAVSNAVSTTGFADNSVMDAIGGSAVEYAAFREWAASVTNIAGNAEAGVAAVIGNEHAAAAYLLGAERLFANAPQIEFVEARAAADGAGGFTMCVGVTVIDGDSAVRCSAEKVRALFEATSDLRDWYGAAKLEPLVTVEASADPAKMRFKASPGDGSAARVFLRIRR